jgi:hypothetical protein
MTCFKYFKMVTNLVVIFQSYIGNYDNNRINANSLMCCALLCHHSRSKAMVIDVGANCFCLEFHIICDYI